MNPEPMIGEEEVTMAICDASAPSYTLCVCKRDGCSPASSSGRRCRDATLEARAAISAHLAALERAGWVLVTREPNFDPETVSYHRGMTRADWWRAMVDRFAAPPPQNSDEVKG